jgi:hypothetical protein
MVRILTLLSALVVGPMLFAQAHLRVPAQQHVVLLSENDDGTCCQAGQCFRYIHFPTRLFPDGHTESFTIPPGRVLVLTDLEWTYSNSVNPFANQTQLFRLLLGSGTSDDVAKSAAKTDDNSLAFGSLQMTSGFTVARGTPLCGFFGFGDSGFLARAVVRGYLDDAFRRGD